MTSTPLFFLRTPKFIIFFFFLSTFLQIHAQNAVVKVAPPRVLLAPAASADCIGAIQIVDSIGPIKGISGRGQITEWYNGSGEYNYLPLKELCTVWFRWEAKEDAVMYMKINAINGSDDYNFALYESSGPWFCQYFAGEYARDPIRANMVPNDQGLTGLSDDGDAEQVSYEGQNSFCKPLKVKRGQEFYLVIDSPVKFQDGFNLSLRYVPD